MIALTGLEMEVGFCAKSPILCHSLHLKFRLTVLDIDNSLNFTTTTLLRSVLTTIGMIRQLY